MKHGCQTGGRRRQETSLINNPLATTSSLFISGHLRSQRSGHSIQPKRTNSDSGQMPLFCSLVQRTFQLEVSKATGLSAYLGAIYKLQSEGSL